MQWVGPSVFDRTGALVLRILSPSTVQAVDTSDGKELAAWKTGSNDSTLAASPDGKLVAIGDPSGFGVRRIEDGATIFRRDVGGVRSVAFRGDGARVIVGMYGPAAHVCDAATGESLLVLSGLGAGVSDAHVSPDLQTIATASGDGTVRLWDSKLGIPLKTWHGHAGRVRRLLFTPDSRRLVTAGDDGTVKVWSAADDWDPFVLKHPQTVYGIAFSPDCMRLACGCLEPGNPSFFMWDVETGSQIGSWLSGQMTAVAWSSDGSRIAVGRHNHPISILDADTGTRTATARLLITTPTRSRSTRPRTSSSRAAWMDCSITKTPRREAARRPAARPLALGVHSHLSERWSGAKGNGSPRAVSIARSRSSMDPSESND